jgi:hypothetical protein
MKKVNFKKTVEEESDKDEERKAQIETIHAYN